MDEAGVFAGPAEARSNGKRSLDDGACIDISAGFEFSKLLMQSNFESLQPLQQHLVVVAGHSFARRVDTAGPRIPRHPGGACALFGGEECLVGGRVWANQMLQSLTLRRRELESQ